MAARESNIHSSLPESGLEKERIPPVVDNEERRVSNNNKLENCLGTIDSVETPIATSWTCSICTFEHTGPTKQIYLACELCGSSRSKNVRTEEKTPPPWFSQPHPGDSTTTATPLKRSSTSTPSSTDNQKTRKLTGSSWGSLRPPSAKDICPRKRQKGLDAPPPLLDYLIVLDFEWTADNTKNMTPIAEITQFPSVAMQLVEKKRGLPLEIVTDDHCEIDLPIDLTMPSDWPTRQDAFAVSAFDTFVRPTFNPKLTKFSIELTAITQEQVDAAPTLDVAVQKYMDWLASLDLVDETGARKGNWTFATWGDVDIMSTLRVELQYKSIKFPPCFDRWINLKSDSMFKKHYGREPRGGLRACVESVGAEWEGRAHNGLVDSINTAKIVRNMVQTGFRFTRPTRGLDKDGIPFGQKR